MSELTHFDKSGRSTMVDVTQKPETVREATASATVSMKQETFQMIMDKNIKKGDVLAVAQVSGIMAAKKTSELIPMCHPLNLTSVSMDFIANQGKNQIEIRATAKITGKTGVEMEALTAVSIAGLTVYDMCKSVDKEITISDIGLLEKSGGKSGLFQRKKAIKEFNKEYKP